MKYFSAIFFLFFISIIINAQTDWYVATDGTDASGNGTLNNPFATITYASENAEPGDNIYVRGGTYRNSDFDNGDIWGGETAVKISALGTPGNYITFMPYNNEQVLIEFDGNYGVFIKDAAYVKFIGFEVKGISDNISKEEAEAAWGLYKKADGEVCDLAAEMGIDISDESLIGTEISKPSQPNISKPDYYNGRGIVANKSHHIYISENIVRDVPSSAIRVQQSDYVNVISNEVFDNTFWTTQGVGAITVAEAKNVDESEEIKIRLERNHVHHNENRLVSWNPNKDFVKFVIDEGTGLFLTRNVDTYLHGKIGIINNLSYLNGASGIVCHFTDGAVIEHNTLWKNGTTNHGSTGGIALNNANDVAVRNNISYARPEKFALGWLSPAGDEINIEGNIIFNENGSEDVHRNILDGWIEADPFFSELPGNYFSLSGNSPAINAGINSGIEIDFLGNMRDAQPDIGAYEYFLINNIEDSFSDDFLKIYPNPFFQYFEIKTEVEKEEVKLFSSDGKNVTGYLFFENMADGFLVKCPTLPSGLYFLKIKNESCLLVRK